MDSYTFYKSMYDRELNRRKDLDAAINLPLTLQTILVTANSYIFKQTNICNSKYLILAEQMLLTSFFLLLTITIFFLTRSYNNLFKGFAYKNFGLLTDVRKFESIDLLNYNLEIKDDINQISFDNIIIDKLNSFTDNHIIINDQRSYDLYLAKTFSIIGLLITSINFLLTIIKNDAI